MKIPICEALPPGAAQRSNIRSFSRGAKANTGNILEAACNY